MSNLEVTVMKFVKILINNIFIPFATFLFILVGVFAALLSAIIEFAVLKELFTSEYQEFIPSFLIALALVLLLEYSKLYLHYLLGRWKHKPDSNSSKYMKKVRIIVSIPIAISFVCTVIFSVTTLDKASYNENAFQTEKTRIENQLKTDIQDGKAALDAEQAARLEPYRQAMETANAEIANFNSGNTSYKKSKNKLDALLAQAESATQNFNTMESSLATEYSNKKTDFENQYRANAEAEIAALTDNADTSNATAYDNKVLSHFLEVIWSIVFHHSSYPRIVYLGICIVFALILSLFLEAIISFSSHFMSIPLDSIVTPEDIESEKLKAWCDQCIMLGIKTACAITIYLFFMLATSEKIQENNFLLGMAACFISIYISQKYILNSTEKSTATNNFTADCYNTIRDSILQGVLALIGYILLGFLFGQTALDLGWPTIAIGLGSSLSSCISELPQKILNDHPA